MGSPRTWGRVAVVAIVCLLAAAPAPAAEPAPGSPQFIQRDLENVTNAYGRITGPSGQLQNPNYLPALVQEGNSVGIEQLLEMAATPTRLSLTPGAVFPGWNVGNPLRTGWDGTRGRIERVQWTNRYGALVRGDVFAPLPDATDPYTGKELQPPYPGVVITTGSVQGSERMYWWLAQDLAERGYVVLTYDVQGQGTSETLPHEGPIDALPFCNPFAPPEDGESLGCPGVPSQQPSNFIFGTEDALDFFVSTPRKPHESPASSDVKVDAFNPYWKLFDRSRDRRTVTPGRTTRIAIIGHSLGAAAVSKVQGTDKRVEAVVALDKLTSTESGGPLDVGEVRPTVPALAVQSEYGFTVQPYFLNGGGSSLIPAPTSPTEAPDPMRERRGGFEAWREARVDSMLIVPRASTHLEYTDIPLVLPASRYGQDLTSLYVQRWLDRYLKHKGIGKPGPDPLLATSFDYLEPTAIGKRSRVTLDRSKQLSFYYCSAYSFHDRSGAMVSSGDISGVGC
jgi:dienelactone hydrolase